MTNWESEAELITEKAVRIENREASSISQSRKPASKKWRVMSGSLWIDTMLVMTLACRVVRTVKYHTSNGW